MGKPDEKKKTHGRSGNGWSVQSPPGAKPSDIYRPQLRAAKQAQEPPPLRVTEEIIMPLQSQIPEDGWTPLDAETDKERIGMEEPAIVNVPVKKGEYNEREDPEAWAKSKREWRANPKPAATANDPCKPRRTRRGKHPHVVVPPVDIDPAETDQWRDYVIKGDIIDPTQIPLGAEARSQLPSAPPPPGEIDPADRADWTDFVGTRDLGTGKGL